MESVNRSDSSVPRESNPSQIRAENDNDSIEAKQSKYDTSKPDAGGYKAGRDKIEDISLKQPSSILHSTGTAKTRAAPISGRSRSTLPENRTESKLDRSEVIKSHKSCKVTGDQSRNKGTYSRLCPKTSEVKNKVAEAASSGQMNAARCTGAAQASTVPLRFVTAATAKQVPLPNSGSLCSQCIQRTVRCRSISNIVDN